MPPKIKFRPIVLENLPRHEIHDEYFVPSSCFDRATCGRRSEIEKIIAMFAHGPGVVQTTNHSAGTTFSAFLLELACANSTAGAL